MKQNRIAGFLMSVWALLFYKAVQAATLSEFMGNYDTQLVQWAALTALLGGLGRTILSLWKDDRVVYEIFKTATQDAIASLFAGFLAFAVVQGVRSSGVAVPAEVRFLAVLIAGAGRSATITWITSAIVDFFTGLKNKWVGTTTQNQPPKDAP